MWETMYNANGVGLAAPQIGKSIRLFVIDASPFSEDETLSRRIKRALLIKVSSIKFLDNEQLSKLESH